MAVTAAISPVAAAALSVDSMNYPAWVKREMQSIPLAPGDRIVAGDTVITGEHGRVWLEAEDGSVIKLGQGARFVVDRERLDVSGDGTFFEAAFDVLRGAFRFTGSFFPRRPEIAHRVDFRVGAVTAGIRGTDIWGRSGDDEDFVALLDGRIEIGSEGAASQPMDQPLTLYRKRANLPADEISALTMAVVNELAAETELSPEAGIAAAGGGYELVLASVPSSVFERAALDRFRQAGYPAEPVAVEVGGVAYTRIVLGGLVDRQAARSLRRSVAAEFSIDDAWIRRRN